MVDKEILQKHVREMLRQQRFEKSAEQGRKLTQAEVAAAADISRSHLAAAEAGHANVSFLAVAKLAQFYNVSLDYLAGFSVSPFKSNGEFARDDEEVALLRCFRAMDESERAALTAFFKRLSRAHVA